MNKNSTTYESSRRTKDQVNEKLRMSHYKELSNKILDGLDSLASKGRTAQIRWIWELIQNAKDASEGLDYVDISIQANLQQVVFSHSGNPFSLDNIFSLINQTSSKNRMDLDSTPDDEDIPETTGKFGTGFITTHLLSKIIYLSSIYKDLNTPEVSYRKFEIILNRSAKNTQEFIREYDKLFNIFDDINDDILCPITEYKQGDMSTTFTYPLSDQNSINVMTEGLQNFRETAAFVLAFNPKIRKIILNDDVYQKQSQEQIEQGIYRLTIINGAQQNLISLMVIREEQRNVIQIAFQIHLTDNQIHIVPSSKTLPLLFSDFPLIGSHTCVYPCVVNSHVFWPNEERSSIILRISKRSQVNQQLLVRSKNLIIKVFDYLISRLDQYSGLENICKISIPDHADQEWYQQSIIEPFIKIQLLGHQYQLILGQEYHSKILYFHKQMLKWVFFKLSPSGRYFNQFNHKKQLSGITSQSFNGQIFSIKRIPRKNQQIIS